MIVTTVTGSSVTPSMARALIDRVRAKGYREGALAFRAAVRDDEVTTFRHHDQDVVMVPCGSTLAAWAALLDHRPADGWLVVITDRSDEDLGAGLLAHLVGQRVRRPDAWEAAQLRFAARAVDAQLVGLPDSPDVARGLLEATPPEGWPPAPAGVLSRDHALGAVARRWIDLPDGPLDLLGVVGWTTRRRATARIADLRTLGGDTLTDAVLSWIAGKSGAAEPLVKALLDRGTSADIVPLGLVFDCLPAGVPESTLARARLEHRWGSGVPESALEAIASAATAVVSSLLADSRRTEDANRVLARADELVREAQADALVGRSTLLRSGLVHRLRRLAQEFGSDPARHLSEIEESWTAVTEHALARCEATVGAFHAAVRLVRWLKTEADQQPHSETNSSTVLAVLAHRQGQVDAWADSAINDAAAGVEDTIMGAALESLLRKVAAVRDRHDREFAQALAAATAEDAGAPRPSAGDPVHLLEDLLASLVIPLAKRTPTLLLVLDGLSTGVASEVIADIVARTDIALTEALLPRHEHRAVALAVLPTITNVSRASLLCGTLLTGQQNVELAGHQELTKAHGLGPSPLFHKKILESSRLGFSVADGVRSAIEDVEGQPLVTCILNTIDDALDRSDPSGTTWSADAVKHLVPLLQRAREAGRQVIITSDHGHVVERRLGEQRFAERANTRFRPAGGPVADDEVLVGGRRVLTADHRAVLAVSERLRYGPLKAGYHGGAAPAEVVVPVVLLVSPGAEDTNVELAPPQEPAWWLGPEGGTTRPQSVERKKPVTAQPGLFDVGPSGFGHALITSPAYQEQRKLAGRVVLRDGAIEALVDALAKAPNRRLTDTQAAQALSVSTARLTGALEHAKKLLNIEGYAVLSIDTITRGVTLDEALLREQFGLAG